MTVEERVRACRLIEKINKNQDVAKGLGIYIKDFQKLEGKSKKTYVDVNQTEGLEQG